MNQPQPEQVIQYLKARLYDATEATTLLQNSLNAIGQASGFEGGNMDELVQHVQQLREVANVANTQDAPVEASDGNGPKRSDRTRTGRSRAKDDQQT